MTSGRHFDSWWKKASRATPDLLTFTTEMLIAAGSERFDAAAFPDRFTSGGVDLELGYVFDPGRRDDGVTVTIPLAVLARVDPAAFERQIPGLRADLAVALIRSLPKTLRRNFVPVPDFAKAALARIDQLGRWRSRPATRCPAELAAALTALTGIVIRPTDFDLDKVPDHLRMNFSVVDEQGRAVGAGQGPADPAGEPAQRHPAGGRQGVRHRRADRPDGVPGGRRRAHRDQHGRRSPGDRLPALVDEGTTVGLQVFTSRGRPGAGRCGPAPGGCWCSARRRRLAHLRQSLTREQLLTLAATPYGTVGSLVADATEAAIDALLDWAGGPAWTAAAFARAGRRRSRRSLNKAVRDVVVAAEQALRAAHGCRTGHRRAASGRCRRGDRRPARRHAGAAGASLAPGFITRTGAAALPDLTRQLQALRSGPSGWSPRRPGTASGSPRSRPIGAEVRAGGRCAAGRSAWTTPTSPRSAGCSTSSGWRCSRSRCGPRCRCRRSGSGRRSPRSGPDTVTDRHPGVEQGRLDRRSVRQPVNSFGGGPWSA